MKLKRVADIQFTTTDDDVLTFFGYCNVKNDNTLGSYHIRDYVILDSEELSITRQGYAYYKNEIYEIHYFFI
jgi:hypothetical protein